MPHTSQKNCIFWKYEEHILTKPNEILIKPNDTPPQIFLTRVLRLKCETHQVTQRDKEKQCNWAENII